MRKIFTLILVFLFTLFANFSILAQDSPKREFRAAWISTVLNIDFPSSPGISEEKMKEELTEILDYLKAANLNAVMFQVRPACDAMYNSTIEPWSYWLSGQQGKAPSGNFDPLEFIVEESHKRGMEMHAWFNPYRVQNESWGLTLDENHIAKQHPEWVLEVDGDKILNPGIPEVREYVNSVIMDVVSRYDIDGVHFDDYFYLQGISNQDSKTFEDYPNGFTSVGDWRRNNVNEFIRLVYNSIQQEKPYVKFGISPPGIWKTGVPDGIFGRSSYSAIYCDAPTWLEEEIVDYLTPQIYWKIGGPQDYSKLMPWWVSKRNGRNIYPGLAFYRANESSFGKDQLGKMISLNRITDGCEGEVFFTAHNFQDNVAGNTDTLKNKYYKFKSFVPKMAHRETTPPTAPSNVKFGRVDGTGTTGITWNKSSSDDVKWYALYKFDNSNITEDDLTNPQNIYDVTSLNYFNVDENFPDEKAYYVVTALDGNSNESSASEVFEFDPAISLPFIPELVNPVADAANQRDTLVFTWKYAESANVYNIEISSNSDFTSPIKNITNIVDTNVIVSGLEGQKKYFWRVRSLNAAGASDFSEVREFTTGFPGYPEMTAPQNFALDVDLVPAFNWNNTDNSLYYQIQVFEGTGVNSDLLVCDSVVNTTEFTSNVTLKPYTIYSWRVRATNEYGTGLYTDIFKFKTIYQLPVVPELLSPENAFAGVGKSANLNWKKSTHALSYKVEVARDELFTNKIKDETVYDTLTVVSDLEGETTYFWRVKAVNNSGDSDYSTVYSFRTGFPKAPILVSPADLTLDVAVNAPLKWKTSPTADNYQVQIAYDNTFQESKIVMDTVVTDTSIYSSTLNFETVFSWRVKALNDVAESNWSEIIRFKTIDELTSVTENETPTKFHLYQNYPNPFNPSTKITFEIPETTEVYLAVYNLLGQQVSLLINEKLEQGRYTVSFPKNDNANISSGIYFYVLKTDKNTDVKKMLLVK